MLNGKYIGNVTRPVTDDQKELAMADRKEMLLVLLDQLQGKPGAGVELMRFVSQLGLDDELDAIVNGDNRRRILVARARELLKFQLEAEGPSVETD